MKGVVVSLLVALVGLAAEESCPYDWWAHEKLLQHEDCNKFYMCTYGKPVEMPCPEDLYFNVTTGRCDWMWNVDCGDRNAPGEDQPTTADSTTADPTTLEPSTETPTTANSTTADPTTPDPSTEIPTTANSTTADPTTPDPSTEIPTTANSTTADPTTPDPTTPEPSTETPTTANSTTADPTTPEPSTETPTTEAPPANEFLENGCPVNPYIHWLLPVEGNCSAFDQCVWGERVRLGCPSPLHFNERIQVCDWPAHAKCNNSGPEPTPPTGGPTTTPSITPTTSTTSAIPIPDEFLENGCPVNPYIHWLLPVEGNCSAFDQCVWGERVRLGCPSPLHFNKIIQVCDWPAHAKCNSSGPEPTPPSEGSTTTTPSNATPTTTPSTPSTATPTTTTPSTPSTATPTTTPGTPSTATPTTTPSTPPTTRPTTTTSTTTAIPIPDEFLANGCPANLTIHWLLPVEGNCSAFDQCVWGERVRLGCPSPLHFNKIIQVCDWPAHAKCNSSGPAPAPPTGGSTTTTSTTTAIPIPDEFLANGCPANFTIHWLLPVEGNCSAFDQCVWGERVRLGCPPSTHFNPKKQVCDWPADAGCSTSLNKHR